MVTRAGVLALQGAFAEQEQALARTGAEPVGVRLPRHLDGLDGLTLPGGESTTIGLLMQRWELLEPIRAFAHSDRPLWGICAGMILMAKTVRDGAPGQPLLGLMEIQARRNAYGRQVNSFEVELAVPLLGERWFLATFIRAPIIESAGGEVEILARLAVGSPVAVQQGNLLATTFHPELVSDDRFHRSFGGLCRAAQRGGT